MTSDIRTFGTSGSASFAIGHDDACDPAPIRRELWFDQDVDGRWLVCAVRRHRHNRAGDLGAIVVNDPRVADFIDMLGQLVDDPSQFLDEPHFYSPH